MRILDKRERMERALYVWLEKTKKVEDDVISLIDHNNVPKKQISKDMDEMKTKLITLKNNLKYW